MKKDEKINWNLIIRWAGTFLSIAILYYLFRQIGAEETWAAVKKISLWRAAAVLGLVFVSRLATWGRWHTLLQVQSLRVRWQDSLRLTFAGLFASNVLPTTIGGDVLRLAGAVRLGIDTALAAASLVADRLVGMTGMALALPFAIPAVRIYLKAKSATDASASLALSAFFPSLMQKLRRTLKKVLDNFGFWLRHPLILVQALGFTFVHMLATFLIVQILVKGMGESISLGRIAGLWSLTYFISLIPISINGLGLQELTITNLFSALGGLQPSTSITLAVILRVVWMIGSLPGAFVLGGIIGGNKDPKSETER